MIEATEMDGVIITPLAVYEDERGRVLKMMHSNMLIAGSFRHFNEIQEIYFSTINPGVVKAWHGHKIMTLNYVCVLGKVKIGLCDLRLGITFGETAQIEIDDNQNYNLVTIPPGIWNGYKSMGGGPAIIANAATEVYNPSEIKRIAPQEFPVPFDWGEYEVAG